MKKPKNKFGYLLVGIFIGVLIAFSIVWWQGNDFGRWGILNKVKLYISNLFNNDDERNISGITDNPENGNKSNAARKITDPGLRNDSAFYDTTNVNLYDPSALDEFLAKYSGQLPDSLLLDSIIKSQNNVDINSYNTASGIEVKKDKLIYAKTFKVPGITIFDGDNPDKLDTLLTDYKGSLQDKTKNIIKVEFWKSPINYKGFKTGVNKIILFGIDQFDMVSFKSMNNTLYMKYMSDFYQLYKTNGFEKLVPVSNQQVLSQLNSK